LDSRYYCLGGAPTLSAGQVTIPSSGSCLQNQIEYCVRLASDVSSVACGLVVVKYTECQCNQQIDVVFVLQFSSRSENQCNLVNFVKNAAGKLPISNTKVNIGVVYFNSVGTTFFKLTGDNNLAQLKFTDLKKVETSGPTNIIAGINKGVQVALDTTRTTTGGRPNPKIIVLLTDGIPTAPCNCQNCTKGDGANPPKIPGTCAPWNGPAGHFCTPCADPVPLAKEINTAWKIGQNGKTSNWKLVSYGFGCGLSYWNNRGWNAVKAMNYDPTQSLSNPWNEVNTAVSQLRDVICNIY
jgi:hypothetical protein